MTNLTPETRKSIYGLVAAAVPLLVIIGAVSDDVAQQVLNIAAALLAVGGSSLAFANVTPSSKNQIAQVADAVAELAKVASAGTGKVSSSDVKKKPAAKKPATTKKTTTTKKK